jgi:acyl-CoA reductase-like NAD-dependent aldehyde dehydrogenase
MCFDWPYCVSKAKKQRQHMQKNEVSVQDLFEKQKAYFATDITKTYEWRIDHLNRLSRMLKENDKRFSEASRTDFKTALQENIFEVTSSIGSIEFTKSQLKEWMKPVEVPIPKFLAASGHKGIVYREPYGVTLIQQTIDQVLRSLSFGGGAVNQTNIFLFIETMPYGGVGSSGIGNYYGKYGFDSLTHAKSILISPPNVAIDHLFPPYTMEKVEALNQWFDY